MMSQYTQGQQNNLFVKDNRDIIMKEKNIQIVNYTNYVMKIMLKKLNVYGLLIYNITQQQN